MTNNDFLILLQAVLDQSGVKKSLKEIQDIANKTKVKMGIDIDKQASQKAIDSLANSMLAFRNNNSAMTREMKQSLDSMYNSLINGANLSDKEVDDLRHRFNMLRLEVRDAGKLGKSFGDSIKQGMASFSTWLPASTIIMSGVNAIRSAINNVKELDDSLLELIKVSDLSASGLEKVTIQAYELGEKVGKTGKQVINAVTEFKRAGYELESSMNMAEAALVMTNVAEGINDTADAAGTLISVLKGFKMSDSEIMSIVDKMNQVSNTSPIGFDELADGLERVSGTMNQAGNSIDQTLGLLTGGYAQLRNIEKVSSGMIFIQQRLRGIDEDGNTIEGLSAKLKKSFGEIGISIENADGSLRSMYEIATDYAKVLPTLTSKQKQYYGELAAGNRQITVWNAITEQIADVENATTQSINSLGSASEENQKYLDSISGKIEILNSALEQLSSTLVNSDLVKFFVDLGTIGVKAIDGIINALTPLGTLGVGAGAFAFFRNLDHQKVLKIA